MADLSKLSDADLMALKANDLSKVSDEGLAVLSGKPVAPQVPQNETAFQAFVRGLKTPAPIPSYRGMPGAALAGALGETIKGVGGATQLVSPEAGQPLVDIGKGIIQGASTVAPISTGVGQVGAYIAPGMAGQKALAVGREAMGLAPQAATLGGRLLGQAGIGGGINLLTTPDEDNRLTSGAIGAAGGAVGELAAPIARGVGNLVSGGLGLTTGVGATPIKEAFKAGVKGGESAQTLAKNLREQVAKTDVLDTAMSNLDSMRDALSKQYRSGMMDISKDASILKFGGIDESLTKANELGKFKGQVTNPKAAESIDEVNQLVNNWKNLNPAEFHTPEGLDALKRQVGGVLESLPFEQKTARKAVGDVYNSIKREIEKQAPTYATVMKDYSQGMDTISEIKRSLSLGEKASVDTGMRKLQSLMRNNVSTNYGNRLDLARALEAQGGQEIMPALAGQSLSSVAPRGLAGLGPVATTVGSLSSGNLAPLALLPLESPRVVGEAALAAGKAARPVINLANSGTPEQRRLAQLLIMKAAQTAAQGE